MTAVIVKETLRKCSSDPLKRSTTTTKQQQQQQQQQQQSAVSKCVNLTLDGYSYVIGKAQKTNKQKKTRFRLLFFLTESERPLLLVTTARTRGVPRGIPREILLTSTPHPEGKLEGIHWLVVPLPSPSPQVFSFSFRKLCQLVSRDWLLCLANHVLLFFYENKFQADF